MIFVETDPYYGIKIAEAKKRFEGDLHYIGTFTVLGEYQPRVVFFNANPNRAKNHKDFMTLNLVNDPVLMRDVLLVGGLDKAEMEPFLTQAAIKCLECQDVIYSINRHSYTHCKCEGCSIDGGRDYTRLGGKNYKLGVWNFFLGEFQENQ